MYDLLAISCYLWLVIELLPILALHWSKGVLPHIPKTIRPWNDHRCFFPALFVKSSAFSWNPFWDDVWSASKPLVAVVSWCSGGGESNNCCMPCCRLCILFSSFCAHSLPTLKYPVTEGPQMTSSDNLARLRSSCAITSDSQVVRVVAGVSDGPSL